MLERELIILGEGKGEGTTTDRLGVGEWGRFCPLEQLLTNRM